MIRPEDPLLEEQVARAKFAAAEDVFGQRKIFEPRGWEVTKPEFPRLLVRFRSRAGIVRAGVELNLRNYDFFPPSVVFLDAQGRPHTQESLGVLLAPFDVSHVPPYVEEGHMFGHESGKGYLPGQHPFTLRPFLCIRGAWEFHSHPQHADVLWEWIRQNPDYNLPYLLEHSYQAFRRDLFD